jgi:hypothetical protein
MNKWIMSACVLMLTAAPVAAADVRLDSWRNPKNENFRIFNRMYLDGVKGGLMASNAWIRSRGGEMAFCMPPDLALSTEQAEEIMLKWPTNGPRKAIGRSRACCCGACATLFPARRQAVDRRTDSPRLRSLREVGSRSDPGEGPGTASPHGPSGWNLNPGISERGAIGANRLMFDQRRFLPSFRHGRP